MNVNPNQRAGRTDSFPNTPTKADDKPELLNKTEHTNVQTSCRCGV